MELKMGSKCGSIFHFIVMLAILMKTISASKLYSKEGQNITFSWTLDPVPDSTMVVLVQHENGFNLFSTRGTVVVLSDIYRARITYTGDTTVGRISFTLQNVTVADGGIYYSRYDASTYPGQTLVVLVKPSNPTIVQETLPEVNTSLILRCSATSNSKPDSDTAMTYIWNVPDSVGNIQNGSKITINSVKLTYNGSFVTCSARDSGGLPAVYSDISENSLPYVIYPLYGPQRSPTLSHTSTQSAVVGSFFPDITCNSVHCNQVCTYIWNKQGQGTISSISGRLVLGTAEKNDKGTYYCTASNSYGSRNSNNLMIEVLYPPQIASLVISGGGQKIMEGHNVIISCNVDSYPAAIITWSYRYNSTTESFPQISDTNDALKLDNVMCTQTGTYICYADNGIGAPVRKEILLEVFCAPRLNVTSSYYETYIVIDLGLKEEFKLTANFISYPVPQIKWHFQSSSYKSNQTLQNGLNNSKITVTSSLYSITTDLVRSKLSESIFGNYTAVASNSFGRSTKKFIVTPVRKPDAPANLYVECKAHNKAEISWTPSFNGGNRQMFTIEYSTSVGIKTFTVTVQSNVKDESRNLTHTVSDLNSNTLYFFKVIAKNIHGSTTSKEVVNCSTRAYTESVNIGGIIAGAVVGCLSVVSVIVIAGIFVFFRRQKNSRKENAAAMKEMKETRSDAEYEDLKSEENNAAYERIKHEGHEHGNTTAKGDLTYEQLQTTREPANYEDLSVNGQKTAAHSSRNRDWNGNRDNIDNPSKSGEMKSQSEKVYENTVMR